MKTLDCAIFYEWEYDEEFVSLLAAELKKQNLSVEVYAPHDFDGVVEKLHRKSLSFRTVIDRASDIDDDCELIVNHLNRKKTLIMNDPSYVRHSSDKASMHLEFITAGIYVPYTIIISPYNTQQEVALNIDQLARLGRPFIIKPANTTGGGIGVVTGAESLREIIDTRQHNKDDKYLLQKKIEPTILDGRRAWFRPFYVFGNVFICWWDDLTHIYFEALPGEIERHGLKEIEKIVLKIREVSGLEFFSTEIAITQQGEFVAIDYVNEMCDMRLKSKHSDGVPDNLVEEIVNKIAHGIVTYCQERRDA